MKTPKSSDSEEVTPSKKVLKQARLPFKIISDESPKSASPQTRKRKLSVTEPEPDPKAGKVTKQNDLSEDLVVISDDDSKERPQVQKVNKQLNPFVKLVDTAYKKKLQKSKGAKKRKSNPKKTKSAPNGSVENDENACDLKNNTENVESVEKMEVDETETKESNEQENTDNNDTEITTAKDIKDSKIEEIIPSKDPNNSTEIKKDDKNDIQVSSEKKENNSASKAEEKETEDQEQSIEKSNSFITPTKAKKPKTEVKDLNTSLISDGEETPGSNMLTPRRSNRKISLTNSQSDVSLNESTNNVNLTPKQLQKKLDSAKKKEEKEKERLEREKKKQQEKDEREKQRREKEEQKKREREEKEEAKKKEREEKEEQRKKEKEEKEKQRELEKKIKEEKEEQKRKEREEKEEQKRKEKEAREEEKRKKQEAAELEKLEQEQKKKKAAEAFASFFVPKQKCDKDQVTTGIVSKNNILSSFTIKSDMRLAPITRNNLTEDSKKLLENLLEKQNVSESSLYVKSLKDGSRKPLSDRKTWPLSDKDDDVLIIEDELPPTDGDGEIITCESIMREKLRPKLLAFHENRRPPYWGTWRKKSTTIKPRRPFKTDEKLDYEVDSDEEWEEEQEGESIDGSAAGSDDEQDADEYEVDNEVFVPHGYLSDEEATMDEDDVLSLSPETQKARLKHLEDEFESEMKKPMEKLKPRLYGLLWETEHGGKPEKCAEALWNYFGKMAMIMNDPTPLLQPSNDTDESEKKKFKKKKAANGEGEQQSPKNEKKKKSKVDDKDCKKAKGDNKKVNQEVKKNQPGINTFLTKLKAL